MHEATLKNKVRTWNTPECKSCYFSVALYSPWENLWDLRWSVNCVHLQSSEPRTLNHQNRSRYRWRYLRSWQRPSTVNCIAVWHTLNISPALICVGLSCGVKVCCPDWLLYLCVKQVVRAGRHLSHLPHAPPLKNLGTDERGTERGRKRKEREAD